MNYKESLRKDFLQDNPPLDEESMYFFECGKAKGFIEAVEKFKPVVEALEKICDYHKGNDLCIAWEISKKALSDYTRTVLGLNHGPNCLYKDDAPRGGMGCDCLGEQNGEDK